jgi:hypothetical protein
MNDSFINEKNDPKFWKTIKQDWKKTKVARTIKQDWRALKDFYLSAEQAKKLKKMNFFKGGWFVAFWLLKSMFYNLTPMRRILLVVSMFLMLNININTNSGNNIGFTNPLFGYLVIIFILMLELKDKLLAHTELQEGKSVQIALLPDESPKIDGWDIWLFSRPANEVCGDLVDFLHLSDNKFYLALGDVAGKGLGAALLMVKLQSTLRAIADDYNNLQELGSKINAIFHRDSLPNKFASLVYLEGSAKNGTVRMLNAGHLPPLVVSGDKISETQKGAPAIGLQGDTKYTEQELILEKNDILFVFSDGLVEACDENDEFFEEPKVHEVLLASKHLPCHEIGKNIMLSVDRFVGERPLYDDLSMIIMKKTT